jgi:hypothetical protein
MKSPVRLSITGEVISCKLVTKSVEGLPNDKFYVVTLQKVNGEVKSFYISTEQHKGFVFDAILFTGNVITAILDDCIADQTQYKDEDGDVCEHETDHLEMINIVNTSKIVMSSEGIPAELIHDIIYARDERIAE